MNKEKEEVKKFNRQLDRILTGSEVDSEVEMDEELRKTLEFARKIKMMEAGPSPEFQSRLQDRLLRRLTEYQSKNSLHEKAGWLEWFTTKRVMWQTVTAVIVIVIAAGIVWSTGVFEMRHAEVLTTAGNSNQVFSETARPAPASLPPAFGTQPDSVQSPGVFKAAVSPPTSPEINPEAVTSSSLVAEIFLDKEAFLPQETVTIKVVVRNKSEEPVYIARFPPEVMLVKEETGEVIYVFKSGEQTITLDPHQEIDFSIFWDQKTEDGKDAGGGRYVIKIAGLTLNYGFVEVPFDGITVFDLVSP